MTTQKSFKRLVRTRMEKTGESYTAARASLLAGREAPQASHGPEPVLATSDAAIRERTGHGWEEWFDRLDAWGAAGRPHREIARWLAEQLGIHPLAWNAQAIAYSYERTHGLRAAGERADGFAVTVTRTVAVPVERLFDAFAGAENACASAPRPGRGPPASTGTAATPGSTSPSWRRARRAAPRRSTTGGSPAPRRPSG